MGDLELTNLDNIAALTAKLAESEAERANQSRQLSMFFDLAIDMFSIADITTGKLVTVNSRWQSCTGWTPEELTSKPFIEFVHPDDVEKTNAHFVEMIEGGIESHDFQNRYAKKDGGWLLLSWRSTTPVDGMVYSVARAVERQEEYLRRYEQIRLHRHAIRSIVTGMGDILEKLSLEHDRLDDIYVQMKAEG
jgi:PAS domain S-box-containing protein